MGADRCCRCRGLKDDGEVRGNKQRSELVPLGPFSLGGRHVFPGHVGGTKGRESVWNGCDTSGRLPPQ